MQKIKNVILCGGNGTRLWPLSRKLMPKQFYKLLDNQTSLFQDTLKRNKSFSSSSLIITNADQYFLANDQATELGFSGDISYLVESEGKNTAAAIALACFETDAETLMFVTPSDHIITNTLAYYTAVKEAVSFANEGFIVTFGIKPQFAETGFGYIEANGNDVVSFKEKPNMETAEQYILDSNFYWNSGMFCFKAGVMLSELKKYAPDIYQTCYEASQNKTVVDKTVRINQEDMMAIPSDSIDYAVIEESSLIKVVPCDIGWNDLGSFDALCNIMDEDEEGNCCSKGVDIITKKSKNNLVFAENKTVAVVGVEDLIIVDTPDALLVTKKGMSQEVKAVVKQLEESNSTLHEIHTTAYRPWGSYTILENSPNYKIKRIVVHPGKSLSLQKHYHRSEHWIVVSGTATVTVGEDIRLVRPNESTYIKMGEVHRLENHGKIPVVLIETQVGIYLGEDDIVRLEDKYGRVS